MPSKKPSRPKTRALHKPYVAAPEDASRAISQLAESVIRTEAKIPGVFTADKNGFVPASGGGTTTFLRADGTWAAAGGGGGVTDGDKGDVTVSGAGTVWTVPDLALKVDTTRSLGVTSPITGGGDLSANRTFGFDQTVTLDNNARLAVRKNTGAVVGTRRRLNLIEGPNITLTVADDAGGEEVDVTIEAASGGGVIMGAETINIPTATVEYEDSITSPSVTAAMNAIISWGAVNEDDENSPAMDNVRFSAVCDVGLIIVTISADSEIVGDIKLNYMAA